MLSDMARCFFEHLKQVSCLFQVIFINTHQISLINYGNILIRTSIHNILFLFSRKFIDLHAAYNLSLGVSFKISFNTELYFLQQPSLVLVMDIFHTNRLDNDTTVYFSVVQKQSQRKFSMNKRLLLMLENHSLCYFSQPNIQFPLTSQYVEKNAKLSIPLLQINKVVDKHEDKKIIINFWIYEKNKRLEKSWTLKFSNDELLQKWVDKFEQLTNRSRKNTFEKPNKVDSNDNIYSLTSNLVQKLSRQNNENVDNIGNNLSNFNPNLNNYQENLMINTPNQTRYVNNFISNDSSFQNIEFVSPSPIKQKQGLRLQNSRNQQHYSFSVEQSKMKDRSIYFANNGLFHPNQSIIEKFHNYYRPYLDKIANNPNSISKNRELAAQNNKYVQFIDYSSKNVVLFIDQKLQRLKQLQRYKDIKLRIKDDSANWIKYTELQDIDIQLGLIELKNVKNDNYVCDGALTKMAMNNIKNLDYLYEVIRKDIQLMDTFYIPMSCVITYKGYTCFVTSKIIPLLQKQEDNRSGQIKEVSKLFDRLAALSKISFQAFENEKCIKFINRNTKKDKFIIMYANKYLPELQAHLIIRKQSFQAVFPQYSDSNFIQSASKKENQLQFTKFSKVLQERVKELSDLMNKLEIYPLSPMELSQILHTFGINVKYLSHLYSNITQFYIQSILKTEAALRVFKLVFNRKLQQNLGRNRGQNLSQISGKQLLNVLLGSSQASLQLWKVISLHSQVYFGLSIDRQEINKGYFILGLHHFLNIQIFQSASSVEKMFKINNFVDGIKFYPKIKAPKILPDFLSIISQQHDISMNEKLYDKLISSFDLEDRSLPSFLNYFPLVLCKINYLLSIFIKPNDNKFQHLKLYSNHTLTESEKIRQFTFFNLQRRMTEIKWQIKNASRIEYILLLSNKLKESIQSFYGKYHPFISEIYELQSLYFIEVFMEEEAITVNKQSLSNMIQCCGNNNRHLKISNNFYQLAQCLKKCYRVEESINNYKKAKNILQINSYQNLPEYAHILFKLGVMYLLQNRDQQSYELFIHAIALYQQSDIYSNWQSLVDLYESIYRCQIKATGIGKGTVLLSDIRLAQHCVSQLEKVLLVELEFQICSDLNFVRLFKVIIEQYFNSVRREDKNILRDYLIGLCTILNGGQTSDFPSLSQSIVYFKSLIVSGKFCTQTQGYMNDTNEYLIRLQNEKRIGRLIPYRRNELIQNYDEYMRNLVVILGQPFLLYTI